MREQRSMPGLPVDTDQQLELLACHRVAGPVEIVIPRDLAPIGFAGANAPATRSTIHFSPRMFSPMPGQMNSPRSFTRNQLTQKMRGLGEDDVLLQRRHRIETGCLGGSRGHVKEPGHASRRPRALPAALSRGVHQPVRGAPPVWRLPGCLRPRFASSIEIRSRRRTTCEGVVFSSAHSRSKTAFFRRSIRTVRRAVRSWWAMGHSRT